jgi:hypothetical protein
VSRLGPRSGKALGVHPGRCTRYWPFRYRVTLGARPGDGVVTEEVEVDDGYHLVRGTNTVAPRRRLRNKNRVRVVPTVSAGVSRRGSAIGPGIVGLIGEASRLG